MPRTSNPPAIAADAIVWSETGDESNPAARLLAHVRLCGTDVHLEAWEIDSDAGDFQEVRAETLRQDDFGTLCNMMDCTFQTTTINGREYVLIATPYGE